MGQYYWKSDRPAALFRYRTPSARNKPGMKRTDTIVSNNNDRDASIFEPAYVGFGRRLGTFEARADRCVSTDAQLRSRWPWAALPISIGLG
jgi:hypothetical protein